MSSGNDNAIWTFSQNFTSEFRSARSELEARLESAKSSPNSELIQALTVDIAKLSKSLADAASSLPTYDQKLYETQLNSLETSLNELRSSITPKSRFAFKRKLASTPSPGPTTHAIKATTSVPSSSASLSNSSISSHAFTFLTIGSLVGPPPTSDLTISELDHCILNLLSTDDHPQPDISAIHLRKISNSVLLLPIINGSILIHDISRCVIVIGCHQFRMHSSTNVDVFLSISSSPIIENCHNIRFSLYPQALLSPGRSEPSVPFSVQDFSHIRSSPSPNWVHMDHSKTSRLWPKKPIQSESEIESNLQAILPCSKCEEDL